MTPPEEFYKLAFFYHPGIYDINETFDDVLNQLNSCFINYKVNRQILTDFLDELTKPEVDGAYINKLWRSAEAGYWTTDNEEVRRLLKAISAKFKE